MLNSGNHHNKMSTVDKTINWILFWNIFLMIVLLGVPMAMACARFVDAH